MHACMHKALVSIFITKKENPWSAPWDLALFSQLPCPLRLPDLSLLPLNRKSSQRPPKTSQAGRIAGGRCFCHVTDWLLPLYPESLNTGVRWTLSPAPTERPTPNTSAL